MNRIPLRLDNQELESLVKKGESVRVELKASIRDKSVRDKVRKTVCAFANDLADLRKPGIIVVGLDDNKQPAKLEITDQLLRELAQVKSDGQILPPPTILVEKRQWYGVDVAVLTVKPSYSTPVRYKGTIYVRSGPLNDTASVQDERLLVAKRDSANAPYDAMPVHRASMTDLNLRLFEEEYLPNAFDPAILARNDRTLEEQLAAAKMVMSADDTTPTVMGMLVLGISTMDYIPCAWLQFLRIDGKDLSDDIIDEERISGDVAAMLRQIEHRLRSHIRTRVDIKGADRERRYESYPMRALQEIVRNAIMHRAYQHTTAPVRVDWYSDRIEVINPGGPFGSMTIQDFGKRGLTEYRNPNLAEALKVLGFVQRFGVGIPTALKLLKEAGHPPLGFSGSTENHASVIIRQKPK